MQISNANKSRLKVAKSFGMQIEGKKLFSNLKNRNPSNLYRVVYENNNLRLDLFNKTGLI